MMREYKEKVSRERDLPADEKLENADEKISYGKKFAKTEELYAAKQMNRELEELAREDGMLEEEAARPEPKVAAAKPVIESKRPAAKRPVVEDVTRGAPIGAMPVATEPPPRAMFSEVLDDAQRYAGMVRGGIRDITTGLFRLARLPVEVAILAANRIRPRHA